MTERLQLLTSIVETVVDYREGDLVAPTNDHGDRWVNQCDAAVRLPILREMDHVLKQTYFSRKGTKEFLCVWSRSEMLCSTPERWLHRGTGSPRLCNHDSGRL
jgi:hypothetical protein